MGSEEESTSTEWHPIRQFLDYPGYNFSLIILNQPIIDEDLFRDLWGIGNVPIGFMFHT